jgi:hypothetical protein
MGPYTRIGNGQNIIDGGPGPGHNVDFETQSRTWTDVSQMAERCVVLINETSMPRRLDYVQRRLPHFAPSALWRDDRHQGSHA